MSTSSTSARSQRMQLAGPFTGCVAVIASWLIAVPKFRALAEELGVEMPTLVRVLVDHAGMITTVAVLIATVGIAALKWTRRHAVRNGISIVTSLILFGLFIWDMVVFWLIYVAMLEGLSLP